MSGATIAVSQAILNLIFGKASPFVAFSPIYVGLFVGDPDSAGVEVTGTGYARISTVAADWNAATAADPSIISNLNKGDFGLAGAGGWGTPDYFALFENLSGGVHFISAGITTPKAIGSGDPVEFAAGSLRITLT